MLAMRFLIEPIGPNASRLTVLNRMDIRLDFIVITINLSILINKFNQVYKFDNFILTLRFQYNHFTINFIVSNTSTPLFVLQLQ